MNISIISAIKYQKCYVPMPSSINYFQLNTVKSTTDMMSFSLNFLLLLIKIIISSSTSEVIKNLMDRNWAWWGRRRKIKVRGILFWRRKALLDKCHLKSVWKQSKTAKETNLYQPKKCKSNSGLRSRICKKNKSSPKIYTWPDRPTTCSKDRL